MPTTDSMLKTDFILHATTDQMAILIMEKFLVIYKK